SSTEHDQQKPMKLVERHRLYKRKRRGDSARGVDEQSHLPVAEALIEQTMVDVVAVGSEDRLAPDEPPRDCDAGIEQRHRQCHQWRRHAEHGGRLLTPDGAEAAKDETN